jgi:hypothetical protein
VNDERGCDDDNCQQEISRVYELEPQIALGFDPAKWHSTNCIRKGGLPAIAIVKELDFKIVGPDGSCHTPVAGQWAVAPQIDQKELCH